MKHPALPTELQCRYAGTGEYRSRDTVI